MKYSKKLFVYIATMCIAAGLIMFVPMVMGDYLLSFIIAGILDVCFLLIIGIIFKDLKLIIYSVIISVVALVLLLLLIYTNIPESLDYALLIATCALGFALLITGIVFFIINLCYINKQKKIEQQTAAPPSDLTYPLSPKSITSDHLQNFGSAYYVKLKASNKTYYIAAGIGTTVCVVIGTLVLCLVSMPVKFMGLIWYILGLALVLLFTYNGLKNKKHYSQNSIEQLGWERLNKYFEQQKSNPNRIIDIPYYSECDELNSINFTPSVYARGGNFESIEAADALLDENGGKFAVCTTYNNTILYPANVFEMSKVLAVSLVNNGETIYETKNQDGLGRAALGYVVAGGFGAMVGASTATTKTVAKKIDDLSVVLTYNDLGRAYLTFKFGKDKANAEQLYQIFTVVCKRNEGYKL